MDSTTQSIQLGQTPFKLAIHKRGVGIFLIRVHGDEVDAARVGKWWVREHGGTFVDVVNETRHVFFRIGNEEFKVDPNRIFSREGIAADLKKQGCPAWPNAIEQAQKLADAMLDQCAPSHIIALHNNRRFNIGYYKEGGECAGSANAMHENPDENPHNLVLVTHPDDFEKLKKHDVNCVLAEDGSDYPGSLSEHFSGKNRHYFNIETEYGQIEKQKELLRIVASLVPT